MSRRLGSPCIFAVGLLFAAGWHAGAGQPIVTNGKVAVEPLGGKGAYTGFRVTAGGKRVADVTFGSAGNITAAEASSLRLGFHEGYGEREVADIVAALTKVERAYLR